MVDEHTWAEPLTEASFRRDLREQAAWILNPQNKITDEERRSRFRKMLGYWAASMEREYGSVA